jgi:hypothetical protein
MTAPDERLTAEQFGALRVFAESGDLLTEPRTLTTARSLAGRLLDEHDHLAADLERADKDLAAAQAESKRLKIGALNDANEISVLRRDLSEARRAYEEVLAELGRSGL